MSVEIERKFLIKNFAWRDQVVEDQHITQAYIKSEDATVRIRCYTDTRKAIVTLKGKRKGLWRLEYEYEIPYKDAKEMQKTLCQGNIVEKTRHLLKHDGMMWELDEFHGINSGLFIAELELKSEDQAFNKPKWVGKEVSYESRYRNSRLSMRPFNTWIDNKKLTLSA